MKTLLIHLNEVSEERGCKNFKFATNECKNYLVESIIKEAGNRYAQQECQKFRQAITNQSVEMIYDRSNEDEEIQFKGLRLRNFQVCYAVSKQSILSTKIELT